MEIPCPHDGENHLLTITEVADCLKLSKRAVQTLIANGELPTIRPTRRVVRFLKRDIIDFIQSHRRGAPPTGIA